MILRRRVVGEYLGTLALVTTVVGSGIMGERLAMGNTALALLANALATGCGLYVLITVLTPISGAHFNPLITCYAWRKRCLGMRDALAMMTAQLMGGVMGVWLAHAMFDLTLLQTSVQVRGGIGQWLGEFTATAGLLLVSSLAERHHPTQLPTLVAVYITGAYWFTSSTAFANPTITFARVFTDTYAGIAPSTALGFIAAQCVGAMLAVMVLPWLSESRTGD